MNLLPQKYCHCTTLSILAALMHYQAVLKTKKALAHPGQVLF